MFSRVVRWLVLRRRATDAGRLGIERVGVARDHLGQIGPDVIEIDGRFLLGVVAVHLGGFDEQDRLALHQRHAVAGRDLA